MSTDTHFTHAVPVLSASDLDRTARFYVERLGMVVAFRQEGYLGLTRDGVQFHFWEHPAHDPATAGGFRVGVEGVEALHDRCLAAGIVHPNGGLREQPWGSREFAILDPDNNQITFAERGAR